MQVRQTLPGVTGSARPLLLRCQPVRRCRYEDGPKGGSAKLWMDAEVAALFRKVRDAG